MPRFRPAVMLTTFYLYGRNEKSGALEGPCGTDVFVTLPAANPENISHAYAVTALHVIQGGASIIRLNRTKEVAYLTGGGLTTMDVRDLEYEPHEWQFDPAKDDLAAIDVTNAVGRHDDLAKGVPHTDLVTIPWMNEAFLTMGEDVFMVGLFSGNPGTVYNQAAARFGNISQIAETRHPVMQGHGVARASFVVDMHSRPGFSGSPVFVYRTPGNDLTAIDQDGNFTEDLNAKHTAFMKLLGIHSAQFKDKIDQNLSVPGSMTVVIPAWRILELINTPHFREQRLAREQEWAEGRGPGVTPEMAQVEPEDSLYKVHGVPEK